MMILPMAKKGLIAVLIVYLIVSEVFAMGGKPASINDKPSMTEDIDNPAQLEDRSVYSVEEYQVQEEIETLEAVPDDEQYLWENEEYKLEMQENTPQTDDF